MKTITLNVNIWAGQSYNGDIDYMPTNASLAAIGHVIVGNTNIEVEVSEPDFNAIKELQAKRDALVNTQKAEIDALNMQIAEAGI